MSVEEGKLPVGLTDEFLDTAVVEQSDGQEAHREAVVIADPGDNDARAGVTQHNNEDKYVARVRDQRIDDLIALVGIMIEQQRLTNFHLSQLTDIHNIGASEI